MTASKAQVLAALEVVFAFGEAIRRLGRVPSGQLYAMSCGRMSLDEYNAVITRLKGTGLVTEVAHELIWTGPAITEG